MALIETTDIKPKKSGGIGGLVGQIAGTAAGGVAGAFAGNPMLGASIGGQAGGMIGGAVDPAKVSGGNQKVPLSNFAQNDREAQLAQLAEARASLPEVPGLTVDEIGQVDGQLVTAMDALKRLRRG